MMYVHEIAPRIVGYVPDVLGLKEGCLFCGDQATRQAIFHGTHSTSKVRCCRKPGCKEHALVHAILCQS